MSEGERKVYCVQPHSVNNPINWFTKQPWGRDSINPCFRDHYVVAPGPQDWGPDDLEPGRRAASL